MKQCKTCGSTYDDRVDFCFRDGTPLARMVAEGAGQAGQGSDPGVEAPPMTEEMDAPVPQALINAGRVQRAPAPFDAAPESVSTAPAELAAEVAEPEAAALPAPLAGHAAWVVKPPEDDEEATLAGLSPLLPLISQATDLPSDATTEESLEPPSPIAPPPVVIQVEPATTPAPTPLPEEDDEPLPIAPPRPVEPPLAAPIPVAPPAPLAAAPAAAVPEDDLDFPSPPPVAAVPEPDSPPEPRRRNTGVVLVLVGLGIAAAVVTALVLTRDDGAQRSGAELAAVEATKAPPKPVEQVAPAEPAAAEPAAAEPAAAEPAAAEPAAAEPAATKPPATTKPTATEPVTTKPPATTKPATETKPSTARTADADVSPWGAPTPAVVRGKLSVASTPAGAKVYLDDKQIGQTPLSADVDYGVYIVRLELDGYRATSQTLKMDGPTAALNLALNAVPVSGQVNLFGLVPGSVVWLGERKLGALPVSTRLEEGTQTFRVVLPDGTSFTQTREIRFSTPGQPVTVTLTGG